MPELKPCPFCGGTALHKETQGWHGIGCQTDKCPAYLHALMFRTAEEAIATWNRRPCVPGASQAGPTDDELKAATVAHFVAKGDRADEWADDSQLIVWFHDVGLPYARAMLAAARKEQQQP